MTARCGCPDDENSHVDGGWRDPVVFGACRNCPLESTNAVTLQAELDRLERPYETTLSDGDGDLG